MSYSGYVVIRRICPGFLLPWLDRMRSHPTNSRFVSGIAWSGIGAVISRALSLLASVVTARVIGREMFGEFGIIQSTLCMFGTFAEFGMGLTANKYVAEYRKRSPVRA